MRAEFIHTIERVIKGSVVIAFVTETTVGSKERTGEERKGPKTKP